MPDNVTIDNVRYRYYPHVTKPKQTTSIEPFGIDTEADVTGKCFMIATSEGDVFTAAEWPNCMFNRKYRGKTYVAYNLKYDEGALIQFLPLENLKELREHNTTSYGQFVVKIIPHKSLVIRKGKDGITVYDMFNFYRMSLDAASDKFIGKRKIELSTKSFTQEYIRENWQKIADYCIQDAVLVRDLARILIKKFESYGVFPKRLYSVAYISFQYFKSHTNYPMVRRYWNEHRPVLGAAMSSYTGGKFEVTEKGIDYYYEYDIVSAYPYEIANLIDISYARVVRSTTYRRQAVYGFLRCKIKVPYECYSPVAVKRGTVNTYPCGEFEHWITKAEYEYLISHNCDVTIVDAYFLHIDRRTYPFRREINKLMELKHRFKAEGEETDYHIIKIFLNSLYGKMVQLIYKGEYYEAGISWNPIYGAVITANVRIRVSEMQSENKGIIAVHTDSIISTSRLGFNSAGTLGELVYETEGQGLILGSGIYQIGDKVRFRGFNLDINLFDLLSRRARKISLKTVRPRTWREVAFHDWSPSRINRFEELDRDLSVDFDSKRLWLDDWKTFQEVTTRKVLSVPLIVDAALHYRC